MKDTIGQVGAVYLQFYFLKGLSVVSINGVLYLFWMVLLLTKKLAAEKESGILWRSDNLINSCSLVIRKFPFLKKQNHISSISSSDIYFFSFRENKGFMFHVRYLYEKNESIKF